MENIYSFLPTKQSEKLDRIRFIINELNHYELHNSLNNNPSQTEVDSVMMYIKSTIKNSGLVFDADNGEELNNKLEDLQYILECSIRDYEQYIENLKTELNTLLK